VRAYEIRVVLVRTIYERNVGATSRAMSNMGASQLILVDPKCEITFTAQQSAASGQEALQNRKVYANWEEFYKNEPADSIRIGMTARDGKGRMSSPLPETLAELKNSHPLFKRESENPIVIHLFLGPEDWGLSADDVKDCHHCCSIPTYGQNASLNLAQAALLTMFIVRQTWGGQTTRLEGQQLQRRKQKRPDDIFPESSLRIWLEEMGFDLSKRKMNVFTVLKRMMLQNVPSQKEYRILEIVLQQSTRKLRELKELKNSSKSS